MSFSGGNATIVKRNKVTHLNQRVDMNPNSNPFELLNSSFKFPPNSPTYTLFEF
ncbi:hypothetical protein LguiA_011750 [Lonicera macranthoides]